MLCWLLGAALTALMARGRDRLLKSIDLVEISLRILWENPSVFVVSLGLLLAYAVFALVWLALFAHLLLIGHFEQSTEDGHGTLSI